MKLFSALAAVVMIVLTAMPSAQAIVVPDKDTTPGTQIYFVASLQMTEPMGRSPHYCGGVLIAPAWVITAKNCTKGRAVESIAVRTGSTDYTDGGQFGTVSRVVPHPARDVALVELDRPVDTAPVAIAAEPGPVGTRTRVLGWGQDCATYNCGGPIQNLQSAGAVIEPNTACGIGEDRICARYGNGGGPCTGDEGGPLVAGGDGTAWSLVGLIPGGLAATGTCPQGRSALVDVTSLRDWIALYAGV